MIDVLDAPAPHVDVFISFRREDRLRVEPLVECVRSANLRVWWDAEISGGSTWRGEILRQWHRAKCALVMWSEGSVSSDALLPVRLHDRGLVVWPEVARKSRPRFSNRNGKVLNSLVLDANVLSEIRKRRPHRKVVAFVAEQPL